MIPCAYYTCPLGILKIGYTPLGIVSVCILDAPDSDHSPSPLTDHAAMQIQQYFAGERKVFDFPLVPCGTPFQTAVWNLLRHIPYGQTRSYSEIAAALGNPKASRAVGMACSKNPIWIAIPCHRVVGKNGSLTGYAGGIDRKCALMELEKSNI